MKTPVETFLAVLDLGGRLAPAEGGGLRAMLPPACPTKLSEAIQTQKPRLLGLLALLSSPQFIMVRSGVGPQLLFWTASEEGRNLLISYGAPPEIIYTRNELTVIARVNPDSEALMLLSECKRLFGSRLQAADRTHCFESPKSWSVAGLSCPRFVGFCPSP